MKDKQRSPAVAWHSLEAERIFGKIDSDIKGLSTTEAQRRLEEIGPNALPVSEPPGVLIVFLRQLKNPLIYILLAAAVFALIAGEFVDVIFIMAIILLNSVLGTYQEYSAEKSAAGLQKMMKIIARVRRSGRERELMSEELVPGDIVLLESGMKVPADLRLLEEDNLAIDESFLTGESNAANKSIEAIPEATVVSDRKNMAFAGSAVVTGRGLGIVVETGTSTQVGMIAGQVQSTESGKPPLVVRMEKFTRQIGVIVIVVSVFLAVVLGLQGNEAEQIFLFVVALAVSAIPEGLPVAMTVALSVAVSRMSKRNVVVRKLTAVESLGSCTVIASDKTGTLTVNQQTVRRIALPNGEMAYISGQGYNPDGAVTGPEGRSLDDATLEQMRALSRTTLLANEGSLFQEEDQWIHYGDAMDVALIALGMKLSILPDELRAKHEILAQIPYESERKYAAAFYQFGESVMLGAKGAAETILGFCDKMYVGGKVRKLHSGEILEQAERMAAEGYRVLAAAEKTCDDFRKKKEYGDETLSGMTLLGLVGFIDPLRTEVIDSVQDCREAGIRIIMITGDHPLTAFAIARELQIAREETDVVTGAQLLEASDPEGEAYRSLVDTSTVFARVSPTQKLEIVDALIDRGEFVAVTGDGVNDVPALRRANIGVAMGSGSDVAKETGSMIVTDDNFSSIVSGVEEGRFAYDNVRKVIYLLISTGAAEVIMFITAIFSGLAIPLIAAQILWLNLVTNGIQDIALAYEGGEPGAMKRKPRRTDEKLFNAQMIRQTLLSGVTIGAIAIGLWVYLIRVLGVNEYSARNMVLLLMVLLQNLHVFNCRSENVSAFRVPIRKNVVLVFGVLAAQGIHLLAMNLPFMQRVLSVEPIDMKQWLLLLAMALPVLIVMEIYKLVKYLITKKTRNENK
ncbi:MAG: HAD-IC family P-type ATPase [Oscillospiraceae bacterium]|nr:HAD-IC family P-type ATPase [Oscillospiraceae bacterium]